MTRPTALALVFPAVFLVHLLGIRPELAGVWRDDAVYLDLGQSLAHGHGWHVPTLPTDPAVAKYPPAWPLLIALVARCGADVWSPGGVAIIIGLAVALYALAAHLVVNRWMPAIGATAGQRGMVGLLLAVNTVTLALVPSALSEPLFTATLMGAVALSAGAQPTRGRAIGIAGLVAMAGLSRSVGGPLALVGAGTALVSRRWRLAGAWFAGWIVQTGIVAWQRAAAGPPVEGNLPFLHYFVSYDIHTRYYTDHARDWAGLAAAAQAVVTRNLWIGPRALFELLVPLSFAGGGDTQQAATGWGAWWVAVGFLALVAVGVVREPRLRLVGALLSFYIVLFLGWTWPDSTRFWVPIFPMLLVCALLGLARLGNLGRLLTVPLVALVFIGNAFDPYHQAVGRLTARATPSDEDRALDAALVWYAATVGAGDVLIGQDDAMWIARKSGASGEELRTLLPGPDLFGDVFGWLDPVADTPRLTGELREAFIALRRAIPTGNDVWVILDRSRGTALLPAVHALAQEGVLEPVPAHEGYLAWRAP